MINESQFNQALLKLNAQSAGGGRDKASQSESASWYQALAEAWGQALDQKAQQITNQADVIREGVNSPSEITMLTAMSLEYQFLSNSAATSNNSVGQGLESIARKN